MWGMVGESFPDVEDKRVVRVAEAAGGITAANTLSPLNKCNSGSPQNQPGTVQLPYQKTPAL
jgi:hypothetical protein